jgi:hypothetical protein
MTMNPLETQQTMTGAVVVLIFYVVPLMIAASRRHRNFAAIAVTNLLLGWTAVGWVVALIWAFTDNVKPKK